MWLTKNDDIKDSRMFGDLDRENQDNFIKLC